MSSSEVYRLFTQEIAEKKRAGRGVFSRASRTGRPRGGMRFPGDFDKSIRKNGEVITSMYIWPLTEIEGVEFEKGKERFHALKKVYTNKQLEEAWGINRSKMMMLIRKFGSPNKPPAYLSTNKNENENREVEPMQSTQTFIVMLSGLYRGEELQARIGLLLQALHKEREFEVSLSIKERGVDDGARDMGQR